MSEDKLQMFANRLSKVFKHRSKLAKKQGISCFRIYDLDMPEFPFCIDLYEDKVYVAEYIRNHNLNEEEYRNWIRFSINTISEQLSIPIENIFIKQRRVIIERVNQYNKYDDTKKFDIVHENGIKFYVNLKDYLDTGLFLDHRLTRKLIGDWSAGMEVCNLFAYTGSFSVYAAINGATRVDTVDLSNTYIHWAKRNFTLNNLDLKNYSFYVQDVLNWLPYQKSNQYDIIICDPPTFSNSKKMTNVLNTQRDHVSIINECLRILKPNGRLIFSTNFSKFKLDYENIKSNKIKDITKATTPFDFEGKLDRWCYQIIKE